VVASVAAWETTNPAMRAIKTEIIRIPRLTYRPVGRQRGPRAAFQEVAIGTLTSW